MLLGLGGACRGEAGDSVVGWGEGEAARLRKGLLEESGARRFGEGCRSACVEERVLAGVYVTVVK